MNCLFFCKDTLIGVRQDSIYHKHLSNDFGCTLICFEIDEESLKSLDYDIDVIIGQITYSEKSDIDMYFCNYEITADRFPFESKL